MIKFKDIFQLNEATGETNIPFQVKKLVDEANTLIDQSIKDEWSLYGYDYAIIADAHLTTEPAFITREGSTNILKEN